MRQQSKELTMTVAGEEDKKRRQAMDWPQSHAKLPELRVCVKRAGQLLLSLAFYSLSLQKLLVCRLQTRRMLSSVHEQTESQVWPGSGQHAVSK